MEWHRLKSQSDIDELMEAFGHFKDSVITEMAYVSGAFIHQGLLMYPVNAKRRLRVIFQRQDKKLPSVEIVFDEIKYLNLAPTGTNNFAQIEKVHFSYEGNRLYWAETSDFSVSKIGKDVSYMRFTWIAAKRAQWRVLENNLGSNQVYTALR